MWKDLRAAVTPTIRMGGAEKRDRARGLGGGLPARVGDIR
jgi:hypothetical protein